MLKKLLQISEILVLLAVPLVLALCAYCQIEQAALLSMLVAFAAIGMLFAGWESSKPPLRQIMPTVVLGALAAAGRILFAPIPDFKPVTAICIIAGVVFGKRCGFMVGALAALVSNMFFGQGPWTPWQMYAWGLIGYLFGVLAEHGFFAERNHKRTPILILVLGFLSALFYGFILNSWYIVGFINPITVPAALAAYAAGLPLDLTHAVATVVFLSVLYLPWRKKLLRIQRKYDLQ